MAADGGVSCAHEHRRGAGRALAAATRRAEWLDRSDAESMPDRDELVAGMVGSLRFVCYKVAASAAFNAAVRETAEREAKEAEKEERRLSLGIGPASLKGGQLARIHACRMPRTRAPSRASPTLCSQHPPSRSMWTCPSKST